MVLASACSGKAAPQVGGETHWLALCADADDCGESGLSCVCGICTQKCSNDAGCKSGACYDTASPLLLQRCDALQAKPSAGICLAQCDASVDCGSGRECVQGACLANRSSSNASGDVVPSSLDAFDSVSADVSWTEPVALVPARLTIDGADERMIGTWKERDCDPSTDNTYPPGCLTLTIDRSSSGEVRGRFRVDANPALGPFSPPVNANIGYPTEVDVSEYRNMLDVEPEVDYQLRNTTISGNELKFDWSSYDIWQPWCVLQTPYRWTVGARNFYFCVPQDPNLQAAIDEGKNVLCTAAQFGPACTDRDGTTQPCSCVENNPRCSPGYCHCDSQRCDVPIELTSGAMMFDLMNQTAQMKWRGTLFYLVKVNP
jgi:hypothetical protein